jgi:hypothetical protein
MLQAQIQQIAARVKICTLKTGAWRPTKLHKAETAAMAARHGTDAGKAVVTHCDHASLKELDQVHNEAYKFHIGHTRPTVDDGVRLIPLAFELEHAQAMGDFQRQHHRHVARLMADYPQMKADAPTRMNGLFDASAWPHEVRVQAKFRFEVSYRPCPTEGEWSDWLSVSAQAAQDELREQLEAAIRRVAERCASDGRLYSTVFSNLKELLVLVPDLNLANDPVIAQVARQAQSLANANKDAAAANESYRRNLAADANRLAALFTPQFLTQAG